jgi:hypothetical protein
MHDLSLKNLMTLTFRRLKNKNDEFWHMFFFCECQLRICLEMLPYPRSGWLILTISALIIFLYMLSYT